MKNNKIYIGILIILTSLMVYVDYQTPPKADWSRTFRNNDSNPFGMKVLHRVLPEIFPEQKIEVSRVPPFNQLSESKTKLSGNYIIIDQYLEKNYEAKGLSDQDVNGLLQFAADGNSVFLASNTFPESLLDKLGLALATVELASEGFNKDGLVIKKKPLKVKLLNPAFRQKTVELEKETYESYFVAKDTLNVKALAVNDSSHTNIIQYDLGKGKLYLCAVPELFTNYYLLKDDKDPIVVKILSYLPVQPVIYDEYTKQGRLGEQSMFRFMKSKPALTWVYYLSIAGLILYLLFEGKRRQRIIPIVKPKENSTLNFIMTVGSLFYQSKDNQALVRKKTELLKWFIFKRTGLRYEAENMEFRDKLIQKTTIPAEEITTLLQWIKAADQNHKFNDDELITFNKMIESLHQKTS